MVMRIGGLASGMDIDELVKKLMSAERAPLNKLYQQKQRYEWQRDAYRSVNTKLKTFDTYIADNFVLKSLISKTATSSNSDLVSATATGKASGSLSIEGVSQLASAARGLSDKQINATGSTKVSDLFTDSPMPTTIELKAIDSNGKLATKDTSIGIDANTTIDQLISKINSSNAGVTAIFEQGKLSITAKNTGSNKDGSGEVQVSTGGEIFGKLGFSALEGQSAGVLASGGKNAIFQMNGITTERTSNNFTINGYNITLKNTFNTEKTTAERYNAAYTEWKYTSSQDYENLIKSAEQAKINAEKDYNNANTANLDAKNELFGNAVISDKDKDTFKKINNPQLVRSLTTEDFNGINGNSFNTKEDYQAWLNDSSENDALKTKLKNANVTFGQYQAMQSLGEEKLKSLSTQAIYDSVGTNFFNGLTNEEKELLKNEFIFPISEEDFDNQLKVWKESADPTEKALGEKLSKLNAAQKSNLHQLSSNEELDKMTILANATADEKAKLAEKNRTENEHKALVDRQNKALVDFKDAYKQQFGQEVDLTQPNNIPEKVSSPPSTVNPVTMTSTTNVDDMMTKIKEFVNTYNGFIKDLNDQLKETKYRDYTPLTSEQKEKMSENEIKLWEEKAMSGLLRNDTLIRNGLSEMRSLVYQSNPAITDSKFNTLFSIGITTSKNYNDGGTLEINEEKLRKALEEDPDAVEKLFKNSEGKEEDIVDGKTVDTRGYFDKLRFGSMKSLQVNIEKKAGRSTMTDAQYAIGKSLIDTESRIDTWKRKLESVEARYWKQFTAMEQAINKANQQSSMFMQGAG